METADNGKCGNFRSADRSVLSIPKRRATCNERGARSSPRHLQRAQSAKFPAPLATSAKREVPRATCNEREARSSPRKGRSRYRACSRLSAHISFFSIETRRAFSIKSMGRPSENLCAPSVKAPAVMQKPLSHFISRSFAWNSRTYNSPIAPVLR